MEKFYNSKRDTNMKTLLEVKYIFGWLICTLELTEEIISDSEDTAIETFKM